MPLFEMSMQILIFYILTPIIANLKQVNASSRFVQAPQGVVVSAPWHHLCLVVFRSLLGLLDNSAATGTREA